ncbi:hypothetical protein BG58_15990 [Caballeronia jiangsuensis]|nr:hypothetical protein BG58_15990 [Caballeronia jiangsuensis]
MPRPVFSIAPLIPDEAFEAMCGTRKWREYSGIQANTCDKNPVALLRCPIVGSIHLDDDDLIAHDGARVNVAASLKRVQNASKII